MLFCVCVYLRFGVWVCRWTTLRPGSRFASFVRCVRCEAACARGTMLLQWLGCRSCETSGAGVAGLLFLCVCRGFPSLPVASHRLWLSVAPSGFPLLPVAPRYFSLRLDKISLVWLVPRVSLVQLPWLRSSAYFAVAPRYFSLLPELISLVPLVNRSRWSPWFRFAAKSCVNKSC